MTDMSLESLEHLDFHFTPPCEARPSIRGEDGWNCENQNPAEYVVTTGCCGTVVFMCQYCLDQRLNFTGRFMCLFCEQTGMTVSTMYASIVRIDS